MFNIFNKLRKYNKRYNIHNTNEHGELIALNPEYERKQELVSVEVKDIKQYLVDEYERSQTLLSVNESLKRQLEESKKVKFEYDASLVTLDEFKKRLEMYESKLMSKDEEIDRLKLEISNLTEQINNYKIQFSRAAISKEEIKAEIIKETKAEISKGISDHKGNLSKVMALSIINNIKV